MSRFIYFINIMFFIKKKENSVLNDIIAKFDMRPAAIIERLSLLSVDYREDTLFSHFGHDDRNWEKIENL